MTEHLQINDVAPLVHYQADGIQAAFIFPFAVFRAPDLEVWLDKVRAPSGFTVSGAGISAGGAVLFAVPPAAGTLVTLRRRVAVERTTDFQTDGIIRAKTLNDELDYQVAALQQVADDLSRCVHRPFTSPGTADLALPEPLAGRSLKWNAAGDGLANSAADVDEAVAIATAQAQAASQARAAVDADRAVVAADRLAVQADRVAATAAATATAADRQAAAADRAETALLRERAQQAASDAETSALSLGMRLVGVSTTTLVLAAGPATLAVGPGMAWVPGMVVRLAVQGEPLRGMNGVVTAYDGGSGRLDVEVEDVAGSGTASAWNVVIGGRRGAPGVGSGDLSATNALGEIAALGAAAQQAARANLGLVPVAASGAYADLSGKPNLGTAAAATLGTGAGQVPTADQVPGLIQGVPTGSVAMFAGAAAPAGWLICDGAAVSRVTYAALFSAVGTAHGAGDGGTTFNLPDLRGRAPIGVGQGSGLSHRPLGSKIGAETHTLSIAETPSHSHSYNVPTATYPWSGNGVAGDGHFELAWSGAAGGGAAHNNMQPSIALNFIIKT